MECIVCKKTNVKLYKEEGKDHNILFCGLACQKDYHGFIDEGVVDFHKDSSDYFRNMNLNNASHREVVIKRIFDDVEASFEEGRTKRLGKSGLAKKLGYFSKGLTDLIAQRKDLTSSERKTYSEYVQQVDAWIVLLKK